MNNNENQNNPNTNQDPTNQDPTNQDPTNQDPTNQDPTNQSNIPQSPAPFIPTDPNNPIQGMSNLVTQTGSAIDYKNRKVRLVPFINEFQRDYTVTTLRRTTPVNYTLPTTFSKIMMTVGALCKGVSKLNAALDVAVVEKTLGDIGLKVNSSLSADLEVLTADPFPLVQSAYDLYKARERTTKYVSSPLYSLATGKCVAARYSRVGLSKLGEAAVGNLYKLYGKDINKIDRIRTMVPVALLRRVMTPWALGMKTLNYSYNPSELFRLQIEMISASADPNNPRPWILSDTIVSSIFKGFDVGEHYTMMMTHKAAKTAYNLGVGSALFIPEIIIDRTDKSIKFVVPPVDKISQVFVDYLNNRLIGFDALNPKKTFKKFRTFSSQTPVTLRDISVEILNVTFYGTDEEVLNELQADPEIAVKITLTDTVLIPDPNANKDDVRKNITEQDAAISDFLVDTMPIHELLWRCVLDEREIRLELLAKEIKEAEQQLMIDLFLEKVTRPEVAKYILSIHTYDQMEQFPTRLREKFHKLSPTFDATLLPEGFEDWELEEIMRETTKDSLTGLNILSILKKRNKYCNVWQTTLNNYNNLVNKYNNPNIIMGEISQDLAKLASLPELQRKTKAMFVEELRSDDSGTTIDYDFTFNTPIWDTAYMPCSLFYNNQFLVKSYGKNINIIPLQEGHVDIPFTNELRCTTNDTVLVFTTDHCYQYHMSQITCSPTDFSGAGDILAVIPLPTEHDIMIITESYVQDSVINGVPERYPSRYITLRAGEPIPKLEFLQGETIKCWCELDKKYVGFLGYNYRISAHTYSLIDTSTIPRTNEFVEMGITPILDVYTTDEIIKSIPFLTNDYDGTASLTKNEVQPWDSEDGPKMVALSSYHDNLTDVFSTSLAVYSENLYISNWEQVRLVALGIYPHTKKSVINELCWCRPDDPISISLDKLKDKNSARLRKGLRVMSLRTTSGYDNFKISNLGDWSLINTRYFLPTVRPESEEHLAIYNDYFDKMTSENITAKDYKKLQKVLLNTKLEIIATMPTNPFIEEVNINVSNLDLSSLNLNGLDNYDEDDE